MVASWNGLAIAALAEAGALFGEPSWVDAAVGAADVLLAVHLGAAGGDRLCRTSRDGSAGRNDGVLDDYAGVAEGFLALFQVTGDNEWLTVAGALIDLAVGHFADGAGGFFDTADDAPPLVRRPRDPSDNAEPSGWLAIANAALTYSALTGELRYRTVAEEALGVVSGLGGRAPRAVGWGLATASALLAGPLEIAVVGESGAADTVLMHRTALGSTSPGAVVAVGHGGDVPLLRDRPMIDGKATAYVCRGFVCQRPEISAEALAGQVNTHPGLSHLLGQSAEI
ncbi:unannotated protein [freshwater metagenome]|uniref:Unannotated protein n=1 Tax=freshwater metagenome TaxID=449393 RepID=A0A6J7EJV9_9ZZZZ